ncbi:MAG: hypothetical protein M3Z74_02215 [Pseudomonadota bacterium]|nr:hypothetical protein [Pseudomonadota bacterium]
MLLELRGGMPTTTVYVGGTPLKLFVDLGGYSAIALTEGELRQVAVRYLTESTRSTNASGDIYETRRFIAPEVSLGGVLLGDLEGSEFVFPETAAPPDRNGYIGFALLSRFLLIVDYPGRSLRLYASGSKEAMIRECGDKSFEIEVVNGVAQTIADTDHGKLVFSWDTGSIRSVIRPSALGVSVKGGVPAPGAAPHRMTKFVLGSRDFGPQNFLPIDYRGVAVDGVLGTDFFVSRVVCLDIGRGKGAVK